MLWWRLLGCPLRRRSAPCGTLRGRCTGWTLTGGSLARWALASRALLLRLRLRLWGALLRLRWLRRALRWLRRCLRGRLLGRGTRRARYVAPLLRGLGRVGGAHHADAAFEPVHAGMETALIGVGFGQQNPSSHQLKVQPGSGGAAHLREPDGDHFRSARELAGAERSGL